MKHVMVPFTIKPEALGAVGPIIGKFISAIKKNEPKTLLYQSLQQADEPTKFIHVMTFSDDASETYHKKSKHCAEFVAALYPLCEIMPKPIVYYETNTDM
ncbi:antibiotic biosynthesis monooxygenase [Flavobacteriaceae bacterium 3-367]